MLTAFRFRLTLGNASVSLSLLSILACGRRFDWWTRQAPLSPTRQRQLRDSRLCCRQFRLRPSRSMPIKLSLKARMAPWAFIRSTQSSNASIESESLAGGENNAIATAQDIDGSSIALAEARFGWAPPESPTPGSTAFSTILKMAFCRLHFQSTPPAVLAAWRCNNSLARRQRRVCIGPKIDPDIVFARCFK